MIDNSLADDVTLKANQDLVTRFFDRLSADDHESLADLVSDDWTMSGGPRNLPPGRDGLLAWRATLGPERHTWQIGQVLGEGDLVAVRATDRYQPAASFGAPAQVRTATFLMRVKNGRIASTWRDTDDLARRLHEARSYR
jgi:ketosteroid isomerase-like protein